MSIFTIIMVDVAIQLLLSSEGTSVFLVSSLSYCFQCTRLVHCHTILSWKSICEYVPKRTQYPFDASVKVKPWSSIAAHSVSIPVTQTYNTYHKMYSSLILTVKVSLEVGILPFHPPPPHSTHLFFFLSSLPSLITCPVIHYPGLLAPCGSSNSKAVQWSYLCSVFLSTCQHKFNGDVELLFYLGWSWPLCIIYIF